MKDQTFDVDGWKAMMKDILKADKYSLDKTGMKEGISYDTNPESLYLDSSVSDLDGIFDYFPKKKCLSTYAALYDQMSYAFIKEIAEQYDGHFIVDCFAPQGRIAMNANCEHKEEATSFIQYAFSYEGQKKLLHTVAGLETNYKVNEEEIRFQYAMKTPCSTGYQDFVIKVDFTKFTPEDIQAALDSLVAPTKPIMEDTKLLVLLVSESLPVLTDGADMDQTAIELANKVQLYLNE